MDVRMSIAPTVGESYSAIKAFLRDHWQNRLPGDWCGNVLVKYVDVWNDRIQSMFVEVTPDGEYAVSGILRPDTVDVLTVVADGVSRSYVAFVEQFRHIAGVKMLSNIAGGIDPGEHWEEAAKREVCEELGLGRGFKSAFRLEQKLLKVPGYASPGMINERVYMLKATVTLKSRQLDMLLSMPGRKTGVAEEGEQLKVWLIPVDQAYHTIANQQNPDLKTLLSLESAGFKPS